MWYYDKQRMVEDFEKRVGRLVSAKRAKDIVAVALDIVRCRSNVEQDDLMLRWYNALRGGTVDYSVYKFDFYLSEVLACWLKYSRRYLKDVENKKDDKGFTVLDRLEYNVHSVLDQHI